MNLLDQTYQKGIIDISENDGISAGGLTAVMVVRKNIAEQVFTDDIFTPKSAYEFLNNHINEELISNKSPYIKRFRKFFEGFDINNYIEVNVFYDQEKSIAAKNSLLHEISLYRDKIQEGQRIISQGELITSDKYQSRKEWFNRVITAKAKSSIKSLLKAETKNRIVKGKEILEEKLSELKLKPNNRILRKLLPNYNVRSKDEFYSKIGTGIINLADLKKVLRKNTTSKWIRYWSLQYSKNSNKRKTEIKHAKKTADNSLILLRENIEDEEPEYTIAKCCNPIPGDEVIGFRDDNDLVTIHQIKCPEAIKISSSQGDSVVQAKWTTHKFLSFLVKIAMSGIDRFGIYNDITTVISKQLSANIRTINLNSHDGIWEGTIELYVHNTKDLNNLIMNISKIKGVESVNRLEEIKQ